MSKSPNRFVPSGKLKALELREGSSIPVSNALSGRIRYNEVTNHLELSENTGAFASILGTEHGIITLTPLGGGSDDAPQIAAAVATGKIVILSPGTWNRAGVVRTSTHAVMFDPASGVHNVEFYGALGDGVVDDTSAILAAMSAAVAAGAGTVLLGPGTYKTTGTLTISGPIDIIGCGPGVTVIYATGAHYGFVIGAATGFFGGSLQNLSVLGTNVGLAGVRNGPDTVHPTGSPSLFMIERVQCHGFTSAIVSHNVCETSIPESWPGSAPALGGCGFFEAFGQSTSYVSCYSYGNTYGLFESGGDEITTSRFFNCNFRTNSKRGVLLRSGKSYAFYASVFESNGQEGFAVEVPAAPVNGIYQLTIDGCHFENNCLTGGTKEASFDNLSGGPVLQIHVAKTTFNSVTADGWISLNFARECSVDRCFGTLSDTPVTATNSTSLLITGLPDNAAACVLDANCIEIRPDASDGSLYVIDGHLKSKVGTGTARACSDGTLYSYKGSSSVGTANKETLGSYSLPSSSLTATGQGVVVEADFTFAGNGNAKTVTIEAGAVTIATNDVTGSPNGGYGKLRAVLKRHSSDTWVAYGDGKIGAAEQTLQYGGDGAWNPTAALAIIVTGDGGAAADITLTSWHVTTINWN
jgi:hypothetical protein